MLRKLLPSALAVTALALAAAPAQAAVPGVNLAGAPTAAELDVAKATGARTVRVFVYWHEVEPNPGVLNAQGWADISKAIGERGLKAVYVLLGTPAWANNGAGITVPPTDPKTMASFAERFAGFEGIKGNVAGYEIWNEQDGEQFWKQDKAARPATYAALVNAVGPAIRRGDPAAKAVLGPTEGNNYRFLQALYDAGIDKPAFDAVGVHTDTACLDFGPYFYYRDAGEIAQFTFLGYRTMRKVQEANGDPKPIWMTELGWSTTGDGRCERGDGAGKKPAGVTRERQAQHLQQAFNCLAEDPYVEVAQWFTLRDNASAPIDELRHYGLIDRNGQAKPSLEAFKAITGSPTFDVLDEACGDFTPPAVRILSPVAGQQFSGALLIRASASDPSTVGRITFRVDDKAEEIRNFTDGPEGIRDGAVKELLWQGAKALSNGPHKITVEAVDLAGNVGSASVTVVKGSAGSIRATIPTAMSVGRKVSCRSMVCKVTGRARSVGVSKLDGKIQVLWQFRAKGRWKTHHKVTKPANRSLSASQRLKKKGRWRVRVRYLGAPPYKASPTVTRTFSVR